MPIYGYSFDNAWIGTSLTINVELRILSGTVRLRIWTRISIGIWPCVWCVWEQMCDQIWPWNNLPTYLHQLDHISVFDHAFATDFAHIFWFDNFVSVGTPYQTHQTHGQMPILIRTQICSHAVPDNILNSKFMLKCVLKQYYGQMQIRGQTSLQMHCQMRMPIYYGHCVPNPWAKVN